MWTPTNRNRDGIQFADLRKNVDARFDAVHDELSDCYYNRKPFRSMGILTKEQFDKLHGLIFHIRDVVFHRENLKLPVEEQVPEEKYNIIYNENGTIVGRKTLQALTKIAALRKEGYELPSIE